jgi:glycosyltransferase involved in cell wall biosynthesis
MPSGEPEVSVLIPLFNGGSRITDTVKSALANTDIHMEVLVHDDGSHADPRRHLEALLADPRVVYTRWSTNRGAASSWNHLVDAAQAPFVKVLPQDDLLVPGSLRAQLDAIRSSGAVVVAGRRRLMTRKGRTVGPPFGLQGLLGLHDRVAVLRTALRIGGNPVGEPGAWLFSREAAGADSFREQDGYAIDLGFLLAILRNGLLYGSRDVQSLFRVSNTAWTARVADQQVDDLSRVLESHLPAEELSASLVRRAIPVMRRRSLARRGIYALIGGFNGPEESSDV